jgi:hypothetical protein
MEQSLFEKTISQLVKKLPPPPFYDIQKFITVFKKAGHLPLSWARSFHSIPSQLIFLRSLLTFLHLHLGLPSGHCPLRLPNKTLLLTYLLTLLYFTYLLSLLTLLYFTYLLTYSLTHSLTPRSRVFLEKLTGSQLVKKFPAYYGPQKFITALASALHLSLSWARSIQSRPPHSTYWRSNLILSFHISQGLPSGLPQVSPPKYKTLYKRILKFYI